MSLVAYAASSDEESDCEEHSANINEKDNRNCSPLIHKEEIDSCLESKNEYISDEDEYAPVALGLQQLKKQTLKLPAPRKKLDTSEPLSIEESIEVITPLFSKLPTPKVYSITSKKIIEEEDDEFLHKKAVPLENVDNEKPPPVQQVRGPVKITIPSLSEFKDVNKERTNRAKNRIEPKSSKGSSLFSILPEAKSERNFAKSNNTNHQSTVMKITSLIPDTVKNRRPAHNTENVDTTIYTKSKPAKEKPTLQLVDCSDSDEGSDTEEGRDFFSLNAEVKLPEVSINEINAMVAKRAAKMADTTTKYLSVVNEVVDQEESVPEDHATTNNQHRNKQLDETAIQALVGSRAKRRRKNEEQIQVMDISGDQVLPNREEWMRTALASSTSYQPTGVLVDEEPASGTRRKHQITYLAHKAKANEAELQAMWATNRQTRRATQSKYGF